MKTIIIAEAGVNHNGSLKLALKLVDYAAKAKADFIKFQRATRTPGSASQMPFSNSKTRRTAQSVNFKRISRISGRDAHPKVRIATALLKFQGATRTPRCASQVPFSNFKARRAPEGA